MRLLLPSFRLLRGHSSGIFLILHDTRMKSSFFNLHGQFREAAQKNADTANAADREFDSPSGDETQPAATSRTGVQFMA